VKEDSFNEDPSQEDKEGGPVRLLRRPLEVGDVSPSMRASARSLDSQGKDSPASCFHIWQKGEQGRQERDLWGQAVKATSHMMVAKATSEGGLRWR
jgi:hypothetical protein